MQPSTREMQGMAASMNGISGDVSGAGHDDFLDQMLSGLSSPWGDLGNPKSPWELSSANPNGSSAAAAAAGDESSLLASRLRQHEIGGGGSPPGSKPMVLQLNNLHLNPQMLLPVMGRSPTAGGGESGLLPLPLTLGSGGSGDVEAAFKSPNSAGGEELYNGFGGPLQHQHFNHTQQGSSIAAAQGYGGAAPTAGGGAAQTPTGAASGGGAGPPRQRVRARRGQATDPHSIAERLRRERIAERMKALQELVPNANKTDKASMLDEIIDYVKFLQLQVKVLSMSRLGGAAAVAPLVANNMSSEGGGSNGNGGAATNDSLTVTEHQVAKLMEEDMGSAMQYLQGKGLCLMPISLASAISSATCHPRASSSAAAGTHQAPPSPSVSVLTVQSAVASGDADDGKGK